MLKKFLSATMALAIVFACMSLPINSELNIGGNSTITASAEKGAYGDFEYNVLNDGTAEIKGYSGSESDVEIPATLGGYTVTRIGDFAFAECKSLTSITIGDNITSIGSWAFAYCDGLTSVKIPDSVSTIGYDAFYDCIALESVTIGDGVELIGGWAFENCKSLISVTIGDSVEYIGAHAFASCESLTSVAIPNGVKVIDYGAFYGCTNLESVTIGNSVEHIYSGAFKDCSALESIYIMSNACAIVDAYDTFTDTATIYGYANSTAQEYAQKYGRTFIVIEETVSEVIDLAVLSSTANSITLDWEKNLDATGYIIEKKVGNSWERVTKISSNATTSYKVTGLACSGKTYSFRIKAYKSASSAPIYSDYVYVSGTTQLSSVTGLTANSDEVKSISLNWTKNNSAAGYIVEKKVGNSWDRVAKISDVDTTSVTISDLAYSDKTYTFRIKAYKNDNGTVLYSSTVSVSATTK